jgi:O-methyltransferase
MAAQTTVHDLYLRTIGIRLHLLRRFLSKQADRLVLPAELQRLLAITDGYTMVDRQRRKNLWRLAVQSEREGLAGDFVELGVCNGGTAGVLAYAAAQSPGSSAHAAVDRQRRNDLATAQSPQPRLTWCYDSFAGLPEPTARDGAAARVYSSGRSAGRLRSIGRCVGSVETLSELLFERLQLDPAAIRIVEGWFQETLAAHPARPIALLHLDGDWYESVKLGLDVLYDRVAPGGWIVLDDYGYWQGCREALQDFLRERRLAAPHLLRSGYTQVYFRKAREG